MKEVRLLSLGYGVMDIMGTPGMAAQNTFNAHISALDGAPFFNGFDGIMGASGVVPAFIIAQ